MQNKHFLILELERGGKEKERVELRRMASFLQAAADSARRMAIAKIPGLIEKNEPIIEAQLTKALKIMKPDEAALFLQNWNKVDTVVRATLKRPEVGARRKRTHRRHRKYRS
jgi:hypothetical protein